MLMEIVNPAAWMVRIEPLMRAHWAESGFCAAQFSIDHEQYKAAFTAGTLFAVAATQKGEVVGYCTVFVSRHHHAGVTVATSDSIYVRPASRRGLCAGKLVATAEAEARNRGAVGFMWHCPAGLSDSFERRGYRALETIVYKEF